MKPAAAAAAAAAASAPPPSTNVVANITEINTYLAHLGLQACEIDTGAGPCAEITAKYTVLKALFIAMLVALSIYFFWRSVSRYLEHKHTVERVKNPTRFWMVGESQHH
jgi:hypothetical protein